MSYISEFTCEGCDKRFGVLNENGAIRCLVCNDYFCNYGCEYKIDYPEDREGQCKDCRVIDHNCIKCGEPSNMIPNICCKNCRKIHNTVNGLGVVELVT